MHDTINEQPLTHLVILYLAVLYLTVFLQVVSPLLEEILTESVGLGRAAISACWRCNICEKRFIARCSLNMHIRNVHKNPGSCDICNKYFASAVLLKIHRATVHTGTKDFLCSICGHQLSSRSNLTKHMGEALRGGSEEAT